MVFELIVTNLRKYFTEFLLIYGLTKHRFYFNFRQAQYSSIDPKDTPINLIMTTILFSFHKFNYLLKGVLNIINLYIYYQF